MSCSSVRYSGATTRRTPWFNWAGLAGGAVDTFREPASLADIVRAVRDAEAAGQHVRVVGSGWAFEDIAYSPDVMLSLVRLNAVLDYATDADAGALLSPMLPNGRRLVHVEAGMKVADLNARLAARGLAMPTLGGANGQSIVGALSTSTHGADFGEGPLCDLVHAIHLVGVDGQEYWIERATAPVTANARLARVLPCPDTLIVRDDDAFDAVVVGLGRFGVIYSVILEAVPAYSLARERTMMLLPLAVSALREGIDEGSFLEPLLGALPPPSAELNATSPRPRAIELVIDSRNPQSVHVVRRWQATGPDLAMEFKSNALCDAGAATILSAGAASLMALGMNPLFVSNPVVLADPTRPFRLTVKQAELLAAATDSRITPGEALALVTNAFWEFDISKVPDLLALVVYQGQFGTQRGPSYAVMTGDPAFNTSTCYRANSCEIVFDATDGRYIDFVVNLAATAPVFDQAGYISLRYSRSSRALLSMHNVASGHAVSIEVSTLKGLRGSSAWIEYVLRAAQALGGRAHWGQQNHPTEAQVQELYGAHCDRWRAILGGLGGTSTVFSNTFTAARGLEPRGNANINVEGTASHFRSSVVPIVSMLLLDATSR